MPSPPGSHPSRQLTVRLPWHVWARLQALAAADPHGARPGRVAATALDRGVEVLERAAALGGRVGASGVADGSKGVQPAADAPTGSPAPALARRVAAKARAAGLDAKARAGVVTVRALTPTEQDLARRYPDWNPSDGEHPGPGTLCRLQAGTEDDPRLRAWKDAATAFLAALNPRDFGRAAPLHAVWEPLAPDGALCFDVCDGTGTTGGAVGLDWQTAWGESDESTIRDWLGEAERRPWDMGPACDGCRGAVG